MDFTPIIIQFLALWWVIPFLLFLALLRTPWFKGIVGESFVKIAARVNLPKETYHRIHNVTLPTPDGTTQIDHIFVSRFGVFVIETKNMNGWIFGSERQAKWTQKIYRNNFSFQNPLRQNYKHVKALEAALDIPAEAIHSVVVFTGESTFKTPMPPNVTRGVGYVTYIRSFSEPVLSEAQVRRILLQITAERLEPSWKTQRQHVHHLKARSAPAAERSCPKCGNAMVMRTAKRGANVGSQFWGCSTFPRCRAVQNIE